MRKNLSRLLMLLLLGNIASANAQNKLLVYIQPQEYENQIKLWQYFRDYWFSQGPYVEKSAKEILGGRFGEISMCDASQQTGQLLVWLRPRMFYNPQSQIYYGTITAVAYTHDGKLIETYVGEANKVGFLDIKPDLQVQEVYNKSMQIVADKMQADAKIQTAISTAIDVTQSATPCSTVSLFPVPKVQLMSF